MITCPNCSTAVTSGRIYCPSCAGPLGHRELNRPARTDRGTQGHETKSNSNHSTARSQNTSRHCLHSDSGQPSDSEQEGRHQRNGSGTTRRQLLVSGAGLVAVAASGCLSQNQTQTSEEPTATIDTGENATGETETVENSTVGTETTEDSTTATVRPQSPFEATAKFVHALDRGDAATIRSVARNGSELEDVSGDELTGFKRPDIELDGVQVISQTDETATVEVLLSEAENSDLVTFGLRLFQADGIWTIDTPSWWGEYLASQSRHTESALEAIDQITNYVVEVTSVGFIHEGVIDKVKLTVRLAPGSGDVNLNRVTIQWVNADGSWKLVSSSSGDLTNADGAFTISSLRDNDTSISDNQTLNSQVDRAIMTIGLDGSDDSIESILDPGQTVEVTIITESGGETILKLVVPESLEGKTDVFL